MSGSPPQISVYVINLDSRPDRWEIIRKICLTAGIHPIRISAVKASPGWHGCALSHKKVAEAAKAAGHPWYIVLEDDATFSNNDWQRFMALVPYLWTHRDKWDIFNGGFGSVEHFKKINDMPIIYECKGYCSHFYFVNGQRTAIDKMASWTTNDTAIDNYAKQLEMWGTYPFISTQADSKSDLSDTNGPQEIIKQSENTIKDMLKQTMNIQESFSGRSHGMMSILLSQFLGI